MVERVKRETLDAYVVSTLWELEDHATAHLMTVFYEHLGHAEGKGQSLREAQLQMIASGDPPYFWAGFEIVGDLSRQAAK
ncbi:MAG: CHAT domain-containing protein [Candidatus Sulfotelmatobacter sp.]